MNFEKQLLETLKDKSGTIKAILKDSDSANKNFEAMGKIVENLNSNPDKVNIQKLNIAYGTALKSLFAINSRIILLQVIYTSSQSFSRLHARKNFKFMPSKHALSVCVNDAFDTQIIGIVNSEGMVTAGEIREQANIIKQEKEDN